NLTARIAELEATIARDTDDRVRIAERLTALEQQCTAALRDAQLARQIATELQEGHVRINDDTSGFREPLVEMRDRVATAEAEAASEDMATLERREATLAAEIDAAPPPQHDDPEQLLADAQLERMRTSLAEAETVLQATRTELLRATDQVVA